MRLGLRPERCNGLFRTAPLRWSRGAESRITNGLAQVPLGKDNDFGG